MKNIKLTQKKLLKNVVLTIAVFLTANVSANTMHTIEPVESLNINTNELIALAKVDIDNVLALNTLTTESVEITAKQKLAVHTELLSSEQISTSLLANAE